MNQRPSPAAQFDASFWKRVDEAFDAALELNSVARNEFLAQLRADDEVLASEIEKLLQRARSNTPTVLDNSMTQALATVFRGNREAEERGFDGLLQRALRADKHTTKSARHPGEVCGAWRLDKKIGEGGMGEVWLAERSDGLYHLKVAIKFLRADMNDALFEARFTEERALLARLNHPSIARLIDAGRKFGTPFLVIEYVEGLPLLEFAAQNAPTLQARIALFEQIVEAVSYAHTRLVVHHDLKPSNIIVNTDGRVKLLDFGVAGLIENNTNNVTTDAMLSERPPRGHTLEYAAPEQITGDAIGVSSDVYSLGAIGYHLLSGHRPHVPEKPGRTALEHAVLHTDALRLSIAVKNSLPTRSHDAIDRPSDAVRIDNDLDTIFAHALQRDPERRYRTADDLLSDLRRHATKRPISSRRTERTYRIKLWATRNWVPVSLVALSTVLLVAGLISTLMQYERAHIEAVRAKKTTQFLSELLRTADPQNNGGSIPDVINLLERAAVEAKTRFRDDPATEFELTELIAATYRSLNRDADALPIALRAVELSQSQFGENAPQTLNAKYALAQIQYWGLNYLSARNTFAPIKAALLKLYPSHSINGFLIEQFDAETLCAVYSTTEAGSLFVSLLKHPALDALEPQKHRWLTADHEAKRASCMTRSGNWKDAYDLLNAHRASYESPPSEFVKEGLYHQEFQLSVQIVLGIDNQLDSRARTLIEKWRSIAGDKSDRIDRLLSIRAQHHQARGDAKTAFDLFQTLLSRVNSKPLVDPGERIYAELNALETQAMFALDSSNNIMRHVEQIVADTLSQINPQVPRYRQSLYRAAIIALTLDRIDRAEVFVSIAAQHAKDNAPSSAIRLLQVQSQLARANHRHQIALSLINQRIDTFRQRGEFVSTRHALLALSGAYELWLSGERDKSKLNAALKRAHQAAPTTLSEHSLFHTQHRWLSSLFEDGTNAPTTVHAYAQVAKYYGRSVDIMPTVLTGLFFL